MGKKKGKKNKGKNDWDDDFDDDKFSKKPAAKKKGGGYGGGFDDGFDDDAGFDDNFDKKKAPPKKKGGGGFDDGFDDEFDDAPKKKMSKAQRKKMKKAAAARKAALEAAALGDPEDDGSDDEEPEDATAQDNAFEKFKAAQAAKGGQSKKQQKKAKKQKAKKVTNAFAAFDDGEEVDSDSIGSDDSSLASDAPKKKLSKKEKKRLAAKRKKAEALAAMMAEEGGDDDEPEEEEADAAEPAEADAAPEAEPEPPAVEAASTTDIFGDDEPAKKKQPKKDKPLSKAQKKKLAKKQAYEKKKAEQAAKKAAAAKKKAEEEAELERMMAEMDAGPEKKQANKPKPKASPTAAGDADEPKDEAQMNKAQLKRKKAREKKAEQARKKKEAEEQKKRDKKKKQEEDYLTRATKAHSDGDYKSVLSYLDMLERGKPEFFGKEGEELRARCELEQANYEKAEKLADPDARGKVHVFTKQYQAIADGGFEERLTEALALLEPIQDSPIVRDSEMEDDNDGGKTKTLYDIVKFKAEWCERQRDAKEKKRLKKLAQKEKKKKGGAGAGGKPKRSAAALARMRAMGIDPDKAFAASKGKKGKNDRKKRGKGKGKSFKTQEQIEREQQEEFERQAAAEVVRKEAEAVRLAAEAAAERKVEEERQARLKAAEDERRAKLAELKKQESPEPEADSGDDWADSDEEEESPKKAAADDAGSESGGDWEDSADSEDNRDYDDESDGDESDVNARTRDQAQFIDDFKDEADEVADDGMGRRARAGASPRSPGDTAAEDLSGQAGVDARRRAKEAEEVEKRHAKFRTEVNKSLKRNQKDWTKQIRKLPERKAYKKFKAENDYENHSRKTLLRDMIADKIQQDDPKGWESYILPEAVILLEGKVKATIEFFSDKRVKSNLRSPIGVIMGHVDTGKTKILDYIRKTKIQDNEVGGITQQIGASFLPMELIKEKAAMVQAHVTKKLEYNLPGLLIIDTPGHESFSNLRARGSSLCDIAVLVVDIMHSLEPQTIESINMLKEKNCTFVIALNKIDRLYDWDENKDWDFQSTFAKQPQHTQNEFKTRYDQAIADLAAKVEVNAQLWYEVAGKNYADTTLICPTSAHTGEGLPDLLMLLCQLSQRTLGDRLQLSRELTATILEVKTTVGHGYTLDVVLQNGYLNRGDTIVVCGMAGPIKTQIRALLVPAEAKEMRAKGEWHHMDQIQAAAGVRISAPGMNQAIAGTQLRVIPPGMPEEDVEDIMDDVQAQYTNVLGKVDKSGVGVYVVASTLGALEALITFLNVEQKVPICGVSIGQVYKKQVMFASTMLEKKPEYAVILAFNVDIDPEAREIAEQMGVRIFEAEIIYNLFDDFASYMKERVEEKRADVKDQVVFPVKLKIFEDKVFRARDPLIMGVKVVAGTLRVNTPLVAMKFEKTRKGQVAAPFPIGVVGSIENEGKDVDIADVGDEVAIKVLPGGLSVMPMYQRHFDHSHHLYSKITRGSIDALKENYREETIKHITLLKLMKQFFNII